MRIAIIDDDADERKTLQASFERLAQESGSAIVIIEFAGADDFLDGYDRSFDLICMPYMRWISYSNPSTTTPSPSKCAVFWH